MKLPPASLSAAADRTGTAKTAAGGRKILAQTLLNREDTVGAMRASGGNYESIPVVVTYHPSYLLRTPTEKAKVWDDLMKACTLVP